MPDRYDLRNILDKGFEVACKVQFENGSPPPDEVSWVMGFVCCCGILGGKVDIGLPEDAPLDQIFDAVEEDVAAFGRRISENQMKQDKMRDRLNGI